MARFDLVDKIIKGELDDMQDDFSEFVEEAAVNKCGKYAPKIKIMLAFVQVATVYDQVYTIKWPPSFLAFIIKLGSRGRPD